MCEVDLCMMNVIEDFVCMNWEMNWFPECILIIMLHARWILLWTYTVAQSLSSKFDIIWNNDHDLFTSKV